MPPALLGLSRRKARNLMSIEKEMNQQLVFDPTLEITAEQFAAAWNLSPYAAQYGPAHAQPQPPATYGSPELMLVLLGAAASIPTSIFIALCTELLKEHLMLKKKKITVTTIANADGQTLYTITTEEK